ncbi:MAG: sulfatase-like hydrolase/transferase [Verrucomicrobiaceae bacterium]|nr:sulfatase-like hydrolase/transferase [Verrucomicrobiaceae bacterium]
MIRTFLTAKRPWNAAFFVLWVLLFTLCDALLLRDSPPGLLAAADALSARFLTHLIVGSLLWMALLVWDRWPLRIVAMATPLLVITNTWLKLWWGKGMQEMWGELDIGGRIEMERAWAAGGVQITPGTVLGIAAVILAVWGVFSACGRISRKNGWRVSVLQLGVLAAISWIVLQIDQAAGLSLKSRAWLWWERKTYSRRMTWIEPKPGLAGYAVEFHNPKPAITAQQLTRKPDIFIFMIESLRDDAVRPDVMPFLHRWRDQECQPLGVTWAASNVTHQSWFSVLSGRLPLFFSEARKEKKMLTLPALLKASGYRVEARMVNDFNYMDMVATNFGEPLEADVMEQVPLDSPENFHNVPAREQRMLGRLKHSVESRSAGSLLAITGLDSTHYKYHWPHTFTPPISDYEQSPVFPMRPSETDRVLIYNRFLNSAAWVDTLLADFVTWLKEKGRYDDAILIVTGDHGEEFKEQGSWFHGTMLNEPQTRVPILIKWPRSMTKPPSHPCASHLDLTPTLLAALGADKKLYTSLPGISLLDPPPPDRTIVMTTHFCGKNGEALLLKRGDHEVAFGWRDFWLPVEPHHMWLERQTLGSKVEMLPSIFSKLTPE